MLETIFPFLFVIFVVGIIWFLLKFILKLTLKIFSLGCIVLLVVGGIIFFLGGSSFNF